MRVVLDTNVLISAFLWRGVPKEIFTLAEKGRVAICVNKEMVEEFERTLSYPKFTERLSRLNKTPAQIIDEFLEVVEHYPSRYFPKPQIKDDPSDDMFLTCAISSNASCIVSGDKHLLALKEFQNIPILTPRQFLNRFKKSAVI